MKATFSEEIRADIVYHIGFANYVKELALSIITGETDLLEETGDIYIITSAKHSIVDISFEEWYINNAYHMYYFNKEFIKEIWAELMFKKESGSLHIIHVEGYFPIVNRKMKGDEILKKLAK